MPADTWHLSAQVKDDSDWCLDTVIRLMGVEHPLAPPPAFVKVANYVLSGTLASAKPPWSKLMPTDQHRAFVKDLVERTEDILGRAPKEYYRSCWTPANHVFSAMRPCAVDGSRWRDLVVAGEGNVPAIRSFQPDASGFANPVVYDRFATLTGRLTVSSGPQILTLKREHRDLMSSRYGADGFIACVDFVSLEARILLYEAGNRCDDDDLYEPLARAVGTRRNIVKGVLLSMLYGGSGRNAKGINGTGLATVVNQIDMMFGIKALSRRLKQQFVTTGSITNRFGRTVRVDEPLDNVFVNYYAQSTGVDVAMVGFNKLLDRLQTEAPSAVPVYVLHDGIYIDVHRDDADVVMKAIDIDIPGYEDRRFPVKVERLKPRVHVETTNLGSSHVADT